MMLMEASRLFYFLTSLPTAKGMSVKCCECTEALVCALFLENRHAQCSTFFLFLGCSSKKAVSCQGASSQAAINDFIDFLSTCPTAFFGALLKLSFLFAVGWSCLNDFFFARGLSRTISAVS